MPSPFRTRWFAVAVYFGCAAGLLVWVGRSKFDRHGDAWEYFAALEAFDRHGTFDVRPGDREAVLARLPEKHTPLDVYAAEMAHGFAVAPDGRAHPLHFWLYPLFAYPAKLGLRAVGGWEHNALKLTNAGLFAWAVGVVLFRAGGSAGRRAAFALLLAVTPAAWYVRFTGAEVFSWAFATVAVVGLDTRRYARGALAAGLAATQNPPLMLLAAVPVLCAAWERRWRTAVFAALGAATGLLPVAYYLYQFGKPSLISGTHVNPALVSVGRTESLLFDLNVGLLPYVPVLLLAAPLGAVALAARRDVRGVLVALAVVGMLLGVQVQVNWNSDCRGLMRYLVWMLPPLAWLVVEGLWGRWRTAAVVASVLTAGAVLLFDPPTDRNHVEHRPLARWVMTHAPEWYNPEVEIFVERQTHREDLPFEAAPGTARVALPLAFGRPGGEVTKLLVHRESAARLTKRLDIDPGYLPELLRVAEASDRPVYVHPPPGAVRATPGTVHGPFDAEPDLRP